MNIMMRTATNLLKMHWTGDPTTEGDLSDVVQYINNAIHFAGVEIDEDKTSEINGIIRRIRNSYRKDGDAHGIKRMNDLQASFLLASSLYPGAEDSLIGMAIEQFHSQRMDAYARYIENKSGDMSA